MSSSPDRRGDLDTARDPLLDELRGVWQRARAAVEARWRRTLPFGDYIVDRWEKARALGFGEGTSIYDSSLVIGSVTVGRHCWIGPNTVLDGSGGLVIGDYCSISAGVHIYSHDTVQWALSGGVAAAERAPTQIGSRCYLGPHVVVAKGVTIGDGSAIGAHSLVLHDIPEAVTAFGVPCRVAGPAPTPSLATNASTAYQDGERT